MKKLSIENYLRNKSVAWYITKCSRVISRLYNEALQPHGISASQSGIIIALHEAHERGERLTQQDLSAILFLNKVNMHNLLTRLEARDLIQKTTHEGDCRCKCVSLTDKGCALVPVIKQIDDEITEKLAVYLDALSRDTDQPSAEKLSSKALADMLVSLLKIPVTDDKELTG